MDTNLYALQMLAAERLTHAREEARRLDLIALGEWLRGTPLLAAARPS